VLSGGWASVRVVPMMGRVSWRGQLRCFARAPGEVFLAAGFGGLHILFGTVISIVMAAKTNTARRERDKKQLALPLQCRRRAARRSWTV